jgi:hypothetical protein
MCGAEQIRIGIFVAVYSPFLAPNVLLLRVNPNCRPRKRLGLHMKRFSISCN